MRTNRRPGPANTRWGPGPVNTNWGPGPVDTNWGPGPVHTNWEPELGARARAGGQANDRGLGNTNTHFHAWKFLLEQMFFFQLSGLV